MNDLWMMAVGLICSAIFLTGMYFQYNIFRNTGVGINVKWAAISTLLIFSSIAAYPGGCAHKYISETLFASYGESFVISFFTLYCLRFAYYKFWDGCYEKLVIVRVDKENKTLKTLFFIPSLISLAILIAVFLGSTASYILGSFDEKIVVVLSDYEKILISASVLCIAFVVKSIFGMSVITFTLTWFAWNYLVHGEYSLSPIFTVIIDLVMGSMPMWAIWLYALFTLLYSLVSSILLSVSE